MQDTGIVDVTILSTDASDNVREESAIRFCPVAPTVGISSTDQLLEF
jgi:hypothetical protein